jgi:hypothetical protein
LDTGSPLVSLIGWVLFFLFDRRIADGSSRPLISLGMQARHFPAASFAAPILER